MVQRKRPGQILRRILGQALAHAALERDADAGEQKPDRLELKIRAADGLGNREKDPFDEQNERARQHGQKRKRIVRKQRLHEQ